MNKEELKILIYNNKHTYSILLKRNHPDIYKTISEKYDFITFGEKIYVYLNDIVGKCGECNSNTVFDGYWKGYRIYCSSKCRGTALFKKSHEDRKCVACDNFFQTYKNKKKTTCSTKCLRKLTSSQLVNEKRTESLKSALINKYGVDHPSKIYGFKEKLKSTKLKNHGDENYVNIGKIKSTKLKNHGDENYNNRNRSKDTCIEKYGVEYPIQLDYFKEKQKNTCLEKYGVDFPTQSNEVKSKIKNTNKDKYGTPYVMQNANIKEKSVTRARGFYYNQIVTSKKLLKYVTPLFKEFEFINTFRDNKYKFECNYCNDMFLDHVDGGHIPRCWDCFPYIKSKAEIDILNFIKELLPNDNIIHNSRHVLASGKELDIYIPSKKIAIEYDGIFWHSEESGRKTKWYHLNKTEECEYNGIKLIHIFENEWFNNCNIVKSRLKSILGSIDSSIFARKCEIKEISRFEKGSFLDEFHLQGNDNSSVRLGAFYNKILVSVMTFGKRRIALGSKSSNEREYELLRFCSNGKNIIGIAGKFMSYFLKKYAPEKIITYANKRYSDQNAFYNKIGFKLIGTTPPNYWYFLLKNPYRLYHRFSFRKDVLCKKLSVFDPIVSEWENMRTNGFDRIWDCGNYKYEWKAN